jgi:hypothetical protein
MLSTPLGGATPIGCRITAGPRLNTTETSELWAQGGSDGTRTHCIATCPGFSKKWPYTSESNYIIAIYSNSSTKVLSGTFTGFTTDEVDINIDVANSNYQVIVEAWS